MDETVQENSEYKKPCFCFSAMAFSESVASLSDHSQACSSICWTRYMFTDVPNNFYKTVHNYHDVLCLSS